MSTRLRHDNRALELFLSTLHSGTSVREIQATCARFANDLIPADAYGWYQFRRGTIEADIIRHVASATASCPFTRARVDHAIRFSPRLPAASPQ